MWVASNDVELVIDWFYRESRAHFLGVFVAGDKKFDALLRGVITNRQTIDIITGPCIDLVVFDTTQSSPDDKIAAPIKHISALTKWTPRRTGTISDAIAMTTHDIAAAMKLSIDNLPGLILMRRHAKHLAVDSERFVLSLRGTSDVDFLIAFLRAFRKSLERIEKARPAGLHRTEGALAEIERTMTNYLKTSDGIKRLDERISRHLEEIQNDKMPQNHNPFLGVILTRLQRTRVARQKTQLRLDTLFRLIPTLTVAAECAELSEQEHTELQEVLDRFERRLSYALRRDRIFEFLGLTEKTLGLLPRIVKLAVGIKSGGASLL